MIPNQKIYKSINIYIINMIPGDPQGLPDEFFSHKLNFKRRLWKIH